MKRRWKNEARKEGRGDNGKVGREEKEGRRDKDKKRKEKMKDRKREGGKTGNEVEGVKEQRMKNRTDRDN